MIHRCIVGITKLFIFWLLFGAPCLSWAWIGNTLPKVPSRGQSALGSVPLARDYLQQEAPVVYRLFFEHNEDAWKKLGDATGGFTLFVPLEHTITEQLGDKRWQQLQDGRNLETTQKMALFHCVNEPVTAEELYNSGGVITLGGVVDIAPSRSGGLFGMIGGKEDGGVLLNGKAKIVESLDLGGVLVHRVDALVSPEILWRYMDQLRIPGSK